MKEAYFVGLDISDPMIEISRKNTKGLSNVFLVVADGFCVPFKNSCFDVAITRLADYSLQETHRILRSDGKLLEYGLGPKADKEIAEFFPERIARSNFFFPENLDSWTDEVSERVEKAGFAITSVQEYETIDYHRSEKEVADLIEMVPLVEDFDREKDKTIMWELARKYTEDEGIAITWHYYILEARKH